MTEFHIADSGIRQTYARFVDAVWRQDDTDFAECFAPDGVWKIAGMEMTGHDAIAEGCRNLLGRCRHIHLSVGHPILEVGDGVAQARVNVTEFAQMHDESAFLTFGWYHDHFVELDGRWLFKSRFWSFKYRGPTELAGLFTGTPDYGSFPAGPLSGDETFVRKA